jgi:hypothetical protein
MKRISGIIKTYYKPYFTNRRFLLSTGFSLVLLLASLIVNYFAGTYASSVESNPVTDIILSHIRVYDVDAIFIYGALFFIFFIIYLCIRYPNYLPFTLKSIALFTVIRSMFIVLTHIAPFPTAVSINVINWLKDFSFSGDLFFSGHTGLPFLIGLIFWDKKYIRWFCIFSSIFFAIVVLMGHLHYSIDVFAAFFITYTIYHISEVFFVRDLHLLHNGREFEPEKNMF